MIENEILIGDCLEKIGELDNKSIQACITSPPYAQQRKNLYSGVGEADYPEWTNKWMEALKPKLTDDGSVLIAIRTNVKNGAISPYVLKTRLLLMENGWKECEELLWLKSDAPPLGSMQRPRRIWEHILWYSQSKSPYIDLYACGTLSGRKGFAGSTRFGSEIHGGVNTDFPQSGVSRISDIFVANVGDIERGIMHPAMFPGSLSDQLVVTFSRKNDMVLDVFSGSGTTCCSAKKLERRFVGIELNKDYAAASRTRLEGVRTETHNPVQAERFVPGVGFFIE